MKINIKRELSIERERSLTIRFGAERIEKFCPNCGAWTRFLTVDETAVLTETSSRQVFREIESGALDFEENAAGILLICLASLLANSEKNLELNEKNK